MDSEIKKPIVEKKNLRDSFRLPWLEKRTTRQPRRRKSTGPDTILFADPGEENTLPPQPPVPEPETLAMDRIQGPESESSIFDGFFDATDKVFTFRRYDNTSDYGRSSEVESLEVAAGHPEARDSQIYEEQQMVAREDIPQAKIGYVDMPSSELRESQTTATAQKTAELLHQNMDAVLDKLDEQVPTDLTGEYAYQKQALLGADTPATSDDTQASEEAPPATAEYAAEIESESVWEPVGGQITNESEATLQNVEPVDPAELDEIVAGLDGSVAVFEAPDNPIDQTANRIQNIEYGDQTNVREPVAPAPNADKQKPSLLNMEPQISDDPDLTKELIDSIKADESKSDFEKQIDIARLIGRHDGEAPEKKKKKRKNAKYFLDPSMLEKSDNTGFYVNNLEIEETRARLEKTLSDYRIKGHVVGVEKGPILTMYEVALGTGIKVNSILAIQDEIRMNLEVLSVRVVAPIPGRATIGIEIPNKKRAVVHLGDILDTNGFMANTQKLPIALGKDIVGKDAFIDLHKLPHLLIAGATGSGKSVAVNSIILSLLFKLSPEEVRFIMIDPKVVELQLYNNIPHLLMPVITDPKDAAKSLAWVCMEMEKRYVLLSALKTRDISSYNEKVTRLKSQNLFPDLDRMPFIVVMIDELGDLMMVAGKEVEGHIIRLTQKARAVGIHLVMATQRPSVDVITALIKANCPARIALQVAQKTDSRTILDASGAETLLGQGDLLYRSPTSSGLSRAQSPFVSEDEVAHVVEEVKTYGAPNYVELATEDVESANEEVDDKDEELFTEAWQVIKDSGKASASFIQRRLRIGYNRAARIIEMMEERGYIGPQIGSKPREILKTG